MFRMFQGPYLQINIQDGAWRSRVKRTTSRVCSEEFDPDVTQCCKWPLKIDFKEFGWDWVLSPKTYDADFCAGDCSLGKSRLLTLLLWLRQKLKESQCLSIAVNRHQIL